MWIVLGVTILAGCSKNPKEKNREIFPNMVHAVPYEAYSSNPLTPDGKTMMAPPNGSIARGQTIYPYDDTEAERAARELSSPIATSDITLSRGKEMYGHYCLICHGEQGGGDGPLIPKFPNPPSFKSKRVMAFSEGRIFHVITRGAGLMSSHAAQILPEDRWKIVQYVQSLQGAKP